MKVNELCDGHTEITRATRLVVAARIQGSTDEERFAGLLVLIKYLNTKNQRENTTENEAWGIDGGLEVER